jgi:hypothetical protein
MGESILVALLLVSLVATANLYWLRVGEQIRERRLQQRLAKVRRTAAEARVSLADRRSFA